MIEQNVRLDECTIERTTLLSGTTVGPQAHLKNSLVGRNAIIGSDVVLDGVVVDHDSTVPAGTKQTGGQWPNIES
jgi:NDP-sugar pyrophosphorylase family protein